MVNLADWRSLVDSLPSDVVYAPDGSLYMERYWLEGSPRSSAASVRFHHILQSDGDRDLHDHPWAFDSLILEGTYEELERDSSRIFTEGDHNQRLAVSAHRLVLHDGPAWTFVRAGPVSRRWGFHTSGGWVSWHEYRATQRVGSLREW